MINKHAAEQEKDLQKAKEFLFSQSKCAHRGNLCLTYRNARDVKREEKPDILQLAELVS